ncbi:matrix-remodeling-associated protein 7 [Stigmatopora nigra]
MDWTFILPAVIFTLLALVVATSLLDGSTQSSWTVRHPASPSPDAGKGHPSTVQQNGHIAESKREKRATSAGDDWCQLSGSSHDHWELVKSEESRPHAASEESATVAAPAEVSSSSSSATVAAPADGSSSSSASSLSVPRPDSRHTSFDSSSEASSGRGRRSFIGLSDQELLKCAFSDHQTDGDPESPEVNDKSEFLANDSLKYIPGKSRSHHMEMMMSKEELEEEQRVQQEQLAAIFQLLKDNTETFGDVSEGDMEEQLRLYSI